MIMDTETRFEFFDWSEEKTEIVLGWLDQEGLLIDCEIFGVDESGFTNGYLYFADISSEVVEELSSFWEEIEDIQFDRSNGDFGIIWKEQIILSLSDPKKKK